MHTQAVAEKFLNDVKKSVEDIMKQPNIPAEGKVYLSNMCDNYMRY